MALLKQQLVRGVCGNAGNVFDTVLDFLMGGSEPGRDWTMHADYRLLNPPYQFDRVVLRNTGKSNNEEIFIGIWAITHTDGISAGLILRVYYQFDNEIVDGRTYATDFFNTTYGSGAGNSTQWCFMPFKTDESTEIWENKPPLELWIYSNKARVILVINTEQRYSNGYMGQYIRHVTPHEVPYPLCCFSDSFNGGPWSSYLGYLTTEWNSGDPNRAFNDDRHSLIYTRHGTWSFQSSGGGSRHFACNRVMTPLGWSYDWHLDPTASASTGIVTATHMNYPDGGFEQLIFPVYIYAYTASAADYYLLGQLDGVYWAPNQRNVALSEIGTSDCIVFPDLNRTYWYSWMALRDEE